MLVLQANVDICKIAPIKRVRVPNALKLVLVPSEVKQGPSCWLSAGIRREDLCGSFFSIGGDGLLLHSRQLVLVLLYLPVQVVQNLGILNLFETYIVITLNEFLNHTRPPM